MSKTSKNKKPASSADMADSALAPFPPSSGLQLLLEQNIKCLYWVENHIILSLPKLITAADDPSLKKAFTQHLKITVNHAKRLEQVFGILGRDVLAKKSDAMEGLAMDGEHVIDETPAGSAERTTGLIMAGRLVENYEIASYTGVIRLAQQLGLDEVASLLIETLQEEQQADSILAELAQ